MASELAGAQEAFTRKMQSILGENFGVTTPELTRRSAGLDSQAGLIVGATPVAPNLDKLAGRAAKLPGVWSAYGQDELHCTFGAMEQRGPAELTQDMFTGYAYLQASVSRALGTIKFDGMPMLLNSQLMVSADTIILAGELNPAAFALREALLASQHQNTPAPLKAGWGCHMTIARATRVLDTEERVATNEWLRANVNPLSERVTLTGVLVGGFTVFCDQFTFTERTLLTI